MVKIPKKIKILGIVCGVSFALAGITPPKADPKEVALKSLQKKILDATNNVPGFDLSIPKIIQEGAQKLAGDRKRFKKLIMTRDDDHLTILSHLVLEYDPSELLETVRIIQQFFGANYKPIAHLFRHRDDRGRSPLYFAVLRKKKPMVQVLLQTAKEIFGHDKKEFLLFMNGENKKGHREVTNYRTPFILAAYNDDKASVVLLLKTAMHIFGKGTKDFKEFIHARDANGATAAFYARDAIEKETKKIGIILRESSQ